MFCLQHPWVEHALCSNQKLFFEDNKLQNKYSKLYKYSNLVLRMYMTFPQQQIRLVQEINEGKKQLGFH